MATRRANISGADCSSNTSRKWNLESICSDNYHLYLVYDHKRIRWMSNLLLLKEFMEKSIKEPGKWTSPGGNSRRFTSIDSDLCVTWYSGKQNTLLFQGKTGVYLREILVKVCEKTASTDGECPIGNLICENENHTSPEPSNLSSTSDTTSLKPSTNRPLCNCLCNTVSVELDDMRLNFEILQSRVDSLQSLANTFDVCKSVDVATYRSEIDCLKQELLDERMKSEQFKLELDLLKENPPNLGDCRQESKGENNFVNKIDLTPDEVALIIDLTATRDIQSDESNLASTQQQNQRSFSPPIMTQKKGILELENANTIHDVNANSQCKSSKLTFSPNELPTPMHTPNVQTNGLQIPEWIGFLPLIEIPNLPLISKPLPRPIVGEYSGNCRASSASLSDVVQTKVTSSRYMNGNQHRPPFRRWSWNRAPSERPLRHSEDWLKHLDFVHRETRNLPLPLPRLLMESSK